MVLYGIPAMPPSIAIVTPVLGGPGTMRVVFHSSSIPRISCEGLVKNDIPNTMEPTVLSTVTHDTMIEPTSMDCDAHAQPLEQPTSDSRDYNSLLSRVLVAERHSSLLESEVKRLELENQRLNSKIEEAAYLQHHSVY